MESFSIHHQNIFLNKWHRKVCDMYVTDKRADVWSRDFIIWKIKSGLWAVVWAGIWNKRVWADYEQLLMPVFSIFRSQRKIWKFKLLARKFTWGNKAKDCWVMSINFDNAQQCFAFTSQANIPAHNLNFHWRWRDRIQAIFFNLFYFNYEFWKSS